MSKRGVAVPVNRVRAVALQAELTNEYSKAAWKEAEAAAWLRWRAEGGQVKRVAPSGPQQRRRGGYYA